jgi:hypothetical protein
MTPIKYLSLPLLLILLIAGGAWAQSAVADAGNKCQKLDEQTAALVNEYTELREKRRRLPQGSFDPGLDHEGGRLSRVLSALGAELGRPVYTKETIVNCLGAPDAVRSQRKMRQFLEIYHRELRKAGRKVVERNGREYLIYFWRGWHDFIFFISEGGVIVDHGWWFAYE